MTELEYKGMDKDAILKQLAKGAEETDSGLLTANQQVTTRRFNILSDHITLPTMVLSPESPQTVDGTITELELKEAGANVEWLLKCEAIEEIGSVVIA